MQGKRSRGPFGARRGNATVNTTIARYLIGVAALLLIAGSLALVAVAVRRRFLADWTGALARLAEVVIAVAALIAMLELLGAVSLFRLVPVTVACVLAGVVAWRRMPGRPPRAPLPGAVAGGLAGAVVTGLAAAVVYGEWASPTLQAYDVGVHVVDSFWYHLPWAATLAQSGQITGLRFTDVEFLTAFYPETGELLHGLGIVLLARDTLSPALNLVWLGLALLSAYCIGRPRGRGVACACGVALALATPMIAFSQPGGADNDIIGVFLLLAAVAFLLNGLDRPPAYILAAIATGLAASVKLTMLLPVAALTVGVLAIAPRGGRRRAALLWLGPELLAGGFWFARNLIAVGNPVPWTSLGFLPTPAPAQQQGTGYTFVHYLTDGRFWSKFAEPAFASGLGRWWVVIVALALAGPLLCLALGPGRLLRMLGLVALAWIAAYMLTPESAGGPLGDPVGTALNIRYSAPALALSLALLPLPGALDGARRQAALVAGLLVVLAATVIRPSLWPDRHVAAAVAFGLVVLVAGVAVALAVRSRRRPGGVLAVTGALVLLGAGSAAGYVWQRHYLHGRYAYRPDVSYLARVWDRFRSIHDARIGLVGSYGAYFAYPLFGLDDSNRVIYIADHGPHGSFTPIRSCRQWRAAVNAAQVRYLLTTPGREFWHPKQLLPAPEAGWTTGDPAAKLIYSERAVGQRVALFALRGPLHPGRCR
jgi:hypothetical protein